MNGSARSKADLPRRQDRWPPEHWGRQLVAGEQPWRLAAGLAVESRDWGEGVLGCRGARHIQCALRSSEWGWLGGGSMFPTVFPVPLIQDTGVLMGPAISSG